MIIPIYKIEAGRKARELVEEKKRKELEEKLRIEQEKARLERERKLAEEKLLEEEKRRLKEIEGIDNFTQRKKFFTNECFLKCLQIKKELKKKRKIKKNKND